MESFDVIVVGAGPAGSRSARLLAGHGFKVLVLEKDKVPRYKACAGGLTTRAQEEAGLDLSTLVERWVYGARCRLDEQHQVDIHRKDLPPVAMVMRDRFDMALAEAAMEAGARLLDGIKVFRVEESQGRVEACTSRGSFRASFLIGADGAAGVTARSLALKVNTRATPAVEAELSFPRGGIDPLLEELVFYDLGAIPGGYAWVFPKLEHYSVGLCSSSPRFHKSVMPFFRRFVSQTPFLASCRMLRLKGALIPLGTTGGRIVTKRCLLAGDAAGCVDPFTGEGVYYALKSGRLAAEAVEEALRSGGEPGLEPYQEAVEQEIYADFRVGRWLAKVYYLFPGLAFRALLKDHRVVSHFYEVMAGRISYRQVLRLARKHWWRLRLH